MIRFFSKLFSVIGMLVTFGLIGGVLFWINFAKVPPLPKEFALTLTLNQDFPEKLGSPTFLDGLMERGLSFTDVIMILDEAKRDNRIKGLVLRVDDCSLGLAQLEELREAIKRLRDAGKYVACYSNDFGIGSDGRKQLYLASVANYLMLQKHSSLMIEGMRIIQPFFQRFLEEHSINFQVLKRSEYKNAFDFLIHKGFTEPHRESLKAFLSYAYQHQLDMISSGRELNLDDVRNIAEHHSILSAEQAQKVNLIDAVGAMQDFREHVQGKLGFSDGKRTLEKHKGQERFDPKKFLSLSSYANRLAAEQKKLKVAKRIAVISGVGAISHADGPSAGFSSILSGDLMRNEIEKAAEDDSINAIILRIDSPGGSSIGSEAVRSAVIYAKERGKKVYASFGNVAASGAYWLACECDKIFASSMTFTGSIGVILAKVSFREILKKLNIDVDSVEVGQNGNVLSPLSSIDEVQLAMLEQHIDHLYDVFKRLVHEGRGLDANIVEELAKGRVWSGYDAQKLGLIDEIGGIYETINRLKEDLGLKKDDVIEIVYEISPSGPLQFFANQRQDLRYFYDSLSQVKSFVTHALFHWKNPGALVADHTSSVVH